MTLHVSGSINIDHVYRLAHFPKSGETLLDATGAGGHSYRRLPASLNAGLDLAKAGRIASADASPSRIETEAFLSENP